MPWHREVLILRKRRFLALVILGGTSYAALRLLLRIVTWLRRYRRSPCVVAACKQDFLSWSAQQLARAIRQRELTSLQVVNACISVLESTRELNAIATERFADARREAHKADTKIVAARPEDCLPPFIGVPIILKEAFEYPGMQYTNGLAARRGCHGKSKGPVVRRVEEAGFIPIASGNVSEACMWMESYNPVYGRSCSPFDLSRTPGGSSGGTAAAVAVLGSPIGVTADIGGSTRLPAHFNGLFGHKPTGGLVPNIGTHLDNFHGAVCRICQAGMVTRHAEDLLPFLKIIAGPPSTDEDVNSSEYLPSPQWNFTTMDFCRLRVVPLKYRGGWPQSVRELFSREFYQSKLMSSISTPLVEGQSKVVEWLRNQGCDVRSMHFEDLAVGQWFDTWADRIQAAGGPSFREVICQSQQNFGVGEIFRYLVGNSVHTFPALALAFVEDLNSLLAAPREVLLEKAARVEDLLAEALGDYGVFVMPVFPRHACKHDEPLIRFLDSCFTSIWNAVEFCSTAVPLGLADGLPFGLQIVSKRGNDELTIALAVALERAGIACCTAPGMGAASPSAGL